MSQTVPKHMVVIGVLKRESGADLIRDFEYMLARWDGAWQGLV